MRYLDITPVDLRAADESLNRPVKSLSEIRATSVSGNGVTGSVFYAFPVVAAVAGTRFVGITRLSVLNSSFSFCYSEAFTPLFA